MAPFAHSPDRNRYPDPLKTAEKLLLSFLEGASEAEGQWFESTRARNGIKALEFERFRSEAGLNSLSLSPSK